MTDKRFPELLFENPLHLPLEKVYLTIENDGEEEQIKALDKFWILEKNYPCYPPLPENDSLEEREKWLKRSKNFIKALLFVLDLPFYKFWSYILYEPSVTGMLDSFFQHAVPCYLPQPTGEYEEPYSKIYDLVLRIYQKICTPKLSETEFLTPESIGVLLKDEEIITNYTLWEICKFYGHTDDGTVENLLNYAYDNIPKLKEELIGVVACTTEIFEAIGTAAYEEEAPTEKNVTKLTNLLYDTAFAINMFMKLYPPFKDICLQEDFFSRIIHTYDSEVPLLYLLMKSVYINNDNPGYERVDNARAEMLETCHNLMSYCMDMILQTSDNNIEQNKWIDTYLKLVTMVITQNTFLTDFNNVFPISQDIDMLQVICPNIDQEKCSSILSVVVEHQRQDEEETTEVPEEEQNGFESLDEATVPEHILLESQITELMDMFPNFGDGFLEQCLINMEMNSQNVIMAILEDNLPPYLATLDRSLPRIPPELPEDEIPLEAAYIGKKPSEHKDLTELLDDKTHVRELKERLLLYGSTVDDMYDDDYDDRDETDFAVGVDFTNIDEVRRPRRRGQVSESENEEEEDNAEEPQPPRDAFCEDPAVVRARREARYQQNRRGGGGGGGGAPQNKPPKDVVGKPKGQGQEKQVLQNRDKKNTQKSSRANHNRRQGAQWKRSKGMIPS